MENKSNSLSRVKRHQREKVLRFSIRKYSFGAASVAVAALMFLGARVASADSVIENNSQNTTDVHNQKEKNKSLAEIQQPTAIKVEAAQNPLEKKTTTKNENVVKVVDKAKLKKVVEELKTTLSSKSDLDKSVISPIKDRVQKGQALLDSDTATQKDVDELLSLLESDLTVLSNATKESNKVQETATENKTEIKDNKITSELSEADKSTSQNKEADKSTTEKKESLKLSTDQLQAALLDLPENETTKEVLEKANEVLSLAQGLLTNTRVTSNELEDLNQRVKRTFNSVKIATLRLTSGKNDPRNGNKIEEGTNVRAASISSRWDSSDNLLIYQRHRASDGSRVVRNGLREYTEKKVDMFAKTTTIDGERYVVYDVFFNNDGASMAHLSRYQIYRLILPPQILDLTSEGLYKGNTLRDLKFETYTRNGNSGTLSQNPENFTRTATHNVNFLNNSTDYGSGWRKLTYFNALDIRHNGEYNRDMRDTFKGNSNDPLLIHAVTRTESKFNRYSYGFGVKTEDRDSAIHMQVKAKLKAGVTDDQVREAFALAVVGTFGLTTNQAYTFISGKDASEPKYTDYPDQPVQPTLREKQAKLYPIQGSRHTKVVGDTIPNTGNPVADKYITRKGSGDFPAGMSWSWEGNNSPSTANAGKFTYTAIARYQDGSTSKDANSGSDGKVHFTVNPKKPTITTSVVNKKGLTNQTIEVNVGSGVKNGSVVKLYDGDRVIGQGTSNGTTARITVSGALPGNPLKAETTVDNGGVVVSEKSDPVTPTEAPDTQAPTLAITPANQTVVEGQNVTFTVTARDNKHVNLDANDFLTKYGTRVFSGKASVTSPTDTDTEKIRTITITTTAEDVGKTNTITFNATDNANHRAAPVSFTFTVTKRDNIPPTITAGNATVTSREQITPISVTAVDNTGGVGMRDNNPIEVTGLPSGLTYANNRITGTPTGAPGNSTVTIKAYDKNGNMATKTITITVRSQADAHNPTGAGLTVNQNHTITDAELKAKVSNAGPGTLSIVSRPSTANAGNAGNAVVKVTYPDGTFDNVNVPVTVTDVTGPTITAESATVTKNESITPIPVTAVDNTGGVGMRDNNPIEVTNLPAGLRYANNQITGTPTAGVGYYTVTIKAYDKNNRLTTKQIRITVRSQADAHNPTGETLTVPYNHNITDDEVKAKVQNFAPGTLTVQSKPSTNTSGNVGNAVVKVTYPDGSHDTVNVPVVVGRPNKDDYTPKYNDGSGKPGSSVEIPVSEANGKKIPTGTTYTSGTPGIITVDKTTGKVTVTIPSDKNPGDKVTGKVLVRYPDGSEEEVPVTVTVVNRDKDDYTPKYNDGSGKPGESVGIPVSEANGKTIPAGTTYTSLTPGVVTVDDKGKVTVTIPADKNPGDKVTGKVLVRYPDGSEEEVPVTVTVTDKDKDIYTPKYEDGNGKPGTKVEIPLKEENGKEIPTGTTYESDQPGVITVDDKGKVTVTIPGDKKPGDKITGKITVTYPDGSKEEVPVTVTVGEQDKDIYTPKYDEGKGKPGSKVEIPLTEENGKKIPTGTTFESDKPGIITVDKDGKVTVTIPEGAKPGDKITGKVLVKYPDGSIEEVPVTVTVGEQDKDIYTPKYDEGKGKPGSKVEIPLTEENGKKIPSGTTFESDKPGIITVDKDGKVTVTIPEGAKPGDKVTGKVTVTYPDGSKEDVPVNVTVTTPAKLTPTVELEQNPNTGDVTVTPKKPDGSTYPPGTKVEIPGKNGNTITVTIGEDGKGTVPNSDLPDRKVPGVARITEPGKPTVEVPVVTTPAKLTPTVELEQDPKTGDVTVTPKKPDGSTYPPGTKVEIPGKNGTPIVVIIGQDGKGTVPNNDLPDGKVPGVAKITEPGKPTVVVPVVTTPAKLRTSEKGETQSQKSSDNKENPTVNKSTKRLANTGESETNTGLAGLGLAMLGSLIAVAKKRREDKE